MISTMSRELHAGERGPPLYLELGLMTGALWLITKRGPLRSLPSQFSNFDEVFISAIRICSRERRFVGVIDEAVIIHLRAGGLHGAQIAAVEIRPHRAAEEIGTPDADLDDYGTRILKRTGNLAAVMRTMGHRDVKTAMQYQHPELEIVRAALDQDTTVEKRA